MGAKVVEVGIMVMNLEDINTQMREIIDVVMARAMSQSICQYLESLLRQLGASFDVHFKQASVDSKLNHTPFEQKMTVVYTSHLDHVHTFWSRIIGLWNARC